MGGIKGKNGNRSRARARGPEVSADPPKRSPASDAPRTEGQRLLVDVPGSLADVAKELGVGRTTVSDWRRGAKSPGVKARAKLRKAYGIPTDAWDMASGSAPRWTARADDAPHLEHVPGAPPACDDGAPLAATLAMIDAQLARLHRIQIEHGNDLAHSEQVRLSETITKTLAQRGRLEKDKKVIDREIERALVKSQPFYTRAINAVVDALKSYPDAALAVESALEALEETEA